VNPAIISLLRKGRHPSAGSVFGVPLVEGFHGINQEGGADEKEEC
jgi:hypothetical protein